MKSKSKKNEVKNKVKTKPEKTDPITTVTAKYESLMLFLDAVLRCNKEAILHIADGKLSVRQDDIGNIYMISAECECKISAENEKSPDKIGIDPAILKKLLIHAKGCEVTLAISQSKIEFMYGRFTAKTVPIEISAIRKEPTPPTMNLPVSLSFPGKYLSDISMAVSRGGKIYAYVKNNVAFLAATEGDTCIKEVVGTTNGGEIARSQYSNDYMRDICATIKGCDCTVYIGIDHPIRICAEKNDCKFEFLLAPRIEAD
jgi:hypothetical protein